jgi:hypothetical protein
MTALAVFLHTVMIVSLGPILAGLIRMATKGGGLRALMEPARTISAGLRAPGQPNIGQLALLALAVVAGLLIPLFSPDAVLGFLGDGFTALMLLTALSIRMLPLRASTVLAAAAALWALGTLSGTTDLAQALASWQAGPSTLLLTLGLTLGVAPLLTDAPRTETDGVIDRQSQAIPMSQAGLSTALTAWTRHTLQLGWLALAMMSTPMTVPLTAWAGFAAALALFLLKLALFGSLLAAISARWPKLPLANWGCAFSVLGLGLMKLGI